MRLVVASLGLLIAAAIVFKATDHDEVYTTIKELSPLVIAILAAYLASRFQARAAFHASLRDVWSDLIDAKNELIAYTMVPSPGPERYAQAYKQLSKAIDELRGVYANVGEDRRYRGWYPFEPLHDMRKTLEALHESPTDEHRDKARVQILRSWNGLRSVFLAELEPPEPTHSITDLWTEDPREDGEAPTEGWRHLLRRLSRY